MLMNMRQKHTPGSTTHSVSYITTTKFQQTQKENSFSTMKILADFEWSHGEIRLSLFMVKTLGETISIYTE